MAHITEKYFNDTVNSIVQSVRFDTSLRPAEENCPFGKETADCLAHFLALAESMGFQTKNYDNYVGEVIFGEGEPLAVLAHLDVVPAGKGWKYPPFGGEINDDLSDGGMPGRKIWGRGTMDDKGPAVATLYAMKALKDEGFTPNRQIKFILGCNEECGWACIDHYNKVAKMPDEGFSPDADFPAIYAEKGILHFTSRFSIKNPPFTSLTAGERVNMVCAEATATLTSEGISALKNYQNDFSGTAFFYDEQSGVLTVKGKSAHGSTPQAGANALGAMLKFFASFHTDCKRAYEVLFEDSLGLQSIVDETGRLSMSPDVAVFDGKILSIVTDIRYPATHKREEIESRLQGGKVDFSVNNYQAPIYNDPNGKLISTLMRVYNEATGKNEKAVAIGGGTYARALKCGCGFGPEMAGEEATIHQANEYVTFERIKLMLEIYYEALKALTK